MDDEAEYTKMLNEDLIKEKEVKSLLKDAKAQEELKVQGNPTNVAEKEAGNQVNKEDQKENNSAGGNGGYNNNDDDNNQEGGDDSNNDDDNQQENDGDASNKDDDPDNKEEKEKMEIENKQCVSSLSS